MTKTWRFLYRVSSKTVQDTGEDGVVNMIVPDLPRNTTQVAIFKYADGEFLFYTDEEFPELNLVDTEVEI